jgi:hypothetical protein
MCIWACSTYGGGKRCIRGFGGKPEGKRTFGRHRRRWGHIKMYLQEMECGGMDWIELASQEGLCSME